MNRQGLLCNLHCATTVVLRGQLNFKSAVIRSKRSCLLGRRFFSSTVNSTSLSHVLVMLSKKGLHRGSPIGIRLISSPGFGILKERGDEIRDCNYDRDMGFGDFNRRESGNVALKKPRFGNSRD